MCLDDLILPGDGSLRSAPSHAGQILLLLACLATASLATTLPRQTPLVPIIPGASNKTTSWGYAQGIGIAITNIGNINLAGGTFQATFLLYSRVSRSATRISIGNERGGDIMSPDECPADTADWFPWQGLLTTPTHCPSHRPPTPLMCKCMNVCILCP